MYHGAGLTDEAIREYERTLALDPSLARAHVLLAPLYASTDRERALHHWQAYLDRFRAANPDWEEAGIACDQIRQLRKERR